MGKENIVFTLPAAMGGVASFNYNIINYASLAPQFHITVILLKAKEDTRAVFQDEFKADNTIWFHYSHKENQYHVIKRLAATIGNTPGAVVCDNALTIQAVAAFCPQKTLFHLLHDYFYVEQNNRFAHQIDVAVAHASFFKDCVYAAHPQLFASSNFYIPYGVKQLKSLPQKKKVSPLQLVFLGRLDKAKGVQLLFEIEQALQAKNIQVAWTIIGQGPQQEALTLQWAHKQNVNMVQPATTAAVYALLAQQDVFIFPTSFEGTPVSILECMANGIVTIVSDLPGGIQDVVGEAVGYRVALNNITAFATAIEQLHTDRALLATKQAAAFNHAQTLYNIEHNANNYFQLFSKWKTLKKTRTTNYIPQLSRLDKSYIPNGLVKLWRSIFA